MVEIIQNCNKNCKENIIFISLNLVSYSIGSFCQENAQCTSLNGMCKEGKCGCPKGMHISKGICFKSVGKYYLLFNRRTSIFVFLFLFKL